MKRWTPEKLEGTEFPLWPELANRTAYAVRFIEIIDDPEKNIIEVILDDQENEVYIRYRNIMWSEIRSFRCRRSVAGDYYTLITDSMTVEKEVIQ